MQIIDADDTRMIDLPGVGPCPRPVDIDQSVTGFTRLKSLRIYCFQPDATIHGDSEVDEVYIVPFGGAVRMQITGATALEAVLSEASGPRALYMAPDHSYELTPVTKTPVAYARAAAVGRIACHTIDGDNDALSEALSFAVVTLAMGDTLPDDITKDRLIHVVTGSILIDGQSVGPTQTAALTAGQSAMVQATATTTLLTFSA